MISPFLNQLYIVIHLSAQNDQNADKWPNILQT